MANWAKNKSRVNEESGRKNEALVYATLFNKRRHRYNRFKSKMEGYKMRKKAPMLHRISIGALGKIETLGPDPI